MEHTEDYHRLVKGSSILFFICFLFLRFGIDFGLVLLKKEKLFLLSGACSPVYDDKKMALTKPYFREITAFPPNYQRWFKELTPSTSFPENSIFFVELNTILKQRKEMMKKSFSCSQTRCLHGSMSGD